MLFLEIVATIALITIAAGSIGYIALYLSYR